jgi:hypothetical protein
MEGKEIAMRKSRKLLFLGVAALLVAASGFGQSVPKKRMKGTPQPLKAVAKALPDTYGTTDVSYYRIGAPEFTAMEIGIDSQTDVWYDQPNDIFRRYGQNGNAYFIAVPHLPAGAMLTYLEFDNCGGATNTSHLYLYSCDYTGDCPAGPAHTIDALPGCGADTADISGLGIVVDNFTGQILLRAVTDANDGSNNFAGVIIGYKLQVSPAPAVATFPDVPTSDFGFQYVEALVASGITGGCGGGLYCPDSPVTRRQMAIFIAKALGLHFQ